ncbi:hypothetical protein GCM10009676_21900 [Prauserella halophila]|uniref:histidine kinase n=1 Tax=Prauserella halophila TaxID=185641 RepID=A0ABP4GWK0_9PSEU|nr:nitrate- and nitrite sensing domain-containing protein [Prauserella halophila]MCP2235617.1 Signal transduction histidine kinase [Prauserella halophila]
MPRRSHAPRDEAADIQRSGGRWRLRNWRLRTRLLAALFVPVLAMLGFAGLRVESNLSQADDYAAATERVRVDDTVANLVHELQRERDLTVRYVAGGRQGQPVEVLRQRDRVDGARGEFEKALTAARPELPDQAVEDFRQWERRLEGLADARYAGQHSSQPAGQVLAAYNEFVAGLLDIGGQAAVDTPDRELARTYLAAASVARVKDALSIRRALVGEALASRAVNPALTRALAGADAQVADERHNHAEFATPDQRRLLDEELTPLVDATSGTVTAVLDGDPSADPATWDRQATQAVDAAKRVEDALREDVRDRSSALASEARSDALIDGAVILGVLLLAGLLAVAITRSLLRPLRTLRTSALDVAHYRLPEAVKGILADPDPRPEDAHRRSVEPVRVYSREELGQVARAFDAVHGQAVRLAGEQAMLRENVNSMFVNLSRRSQDLVERQLTVLDRMEEHEQDPDVLGGLFELDHLATRMRRNSENLLVLAGQDVGRPLPGAVAAEEIMGAALSEVEHYQRISVAATPQIGVRGEIVGDLVHVISELFENATDYSPDDSPVSVVSAVTQDGEWRIDITDRGAGMPETEIRRANVRLSEVPDVDVEVSRRMGLYVVARLARQHDIRVWLSAADLMGLTATVVVPAALVRQADSSPRESPVALESATGEEEPAQQGPPSSVVFRPEPQRRPATALPSEPEPSEPLAAADEPVDGPASAPVSKRAPGQGSVREQPVAELFADPYAGADTFTRPVPEPAPAPVSPPGPEPEQESEPGPGPELALEPKPEPEQEPEREPAVESAIEPDTAAASGVPAGPGITDGAEPAPVLPRRRPAVSEVLSEGGDESAAPAGAEHADHAEGADRAEHADRVERVKAPPEIGDIDNTGNIGHTGDVEDTAGYAEDAGGAGEGGLSGAGPADAVSAERPVQPRRPVRRPGAAPAADESLTEEIPRIVGVPDSGRAAVFGRREADWDEDPDAASAAAHPPVPESAAEVTDGPTAPIPVVGSLEAATETAAGSTAATATSAATSAANPPATEPDVVAGIPTGARIDEVAPARGESPGDGPAAERVARPPREPESGPAEQTDVSGWGPGPTWPMRDGDEPTATPRSRPEPRPQPAARPQPEPRSQPAARPQPEPRPRPESEPRPRPESQPQSQPQPRPAPISPRESEPALGDDAPTDRMAIYHRLMTRWFEPGGDDQDWPVEPAGYNGSGQGGGPGRSDSPRNGAEPGRWHRNGDGRAVPGEGAEPHPAGPAGFGPGGAGQGGYGQGGYGQGGAGQSHPGQGGFGQGGFGQGAAERNGTGPAGTDPDRTNADGTTAEGATADRAAADGTAGTTAGQSGHRNGNDTDGGRPRLQSTFIDRSPEAIRDRMSGLQQATARARHARSR